MSHSPHNEGSDKQSMDSQNWHAGDNLARDREQSTLLHEPNFIISRVDPISGVTIDDVAGHPSIQDGNVTIYFENETTRQAYQDLPMDHPLRLADNPNEEGEAEG